MSEQYRRTTEVQDSDESLYNFPTIDASELTRFPDGIKDVHRRRIDGFLIRNVLTQEEIGRILGGIARIPKSKLCRMPEGFFFPRIFAHVAQEAAASGNSGLVEDYFRECEEIIASLPELYGVRVTDKIEKVLSTMAGGRKVQVPKGDGGKGSYMNSTLRVYNPPAGNISVHCGNYFQVTFPQFYQRLADTLSLRDQMSYFFLLQNCDRGGELTLYDLVWEDGQTKTEADENREIILSNGERLDIEDRQKVRRRLIRPNAGDMILFAGGSIWHRVEEVAGSKPRITMGGFLSFAKDDSTIFYWS